MDAPEESGQQPVHYANWSSFFYFVAYIVVVAYTLLNLYIGGCGTTAAPGGGVMTVLEYREGSHSSVGNGGVALQHVLAQLDQHHALGQYAPTRQHS
jgi:hypothetical protein